MYSLSTVMSQQVQNLLNKDSITQLLFSRIAVSFIFVKYFFAENVLNREIKYAD